MDVVTYALAKKMASSVASGITEIETNGTTIRFKTTSGDWFTVTLNSINEVSVSANGHLIVKLSDGTQIDCGALPVGTMDSSLSTTSENGVQNKVITNALNGKQNTLVQGSGITIDTTDPTHPQISANIDYTNLINKPTKLSDFTNDENFITNTANNLSNYYLKTETYTQSEVNDLISQLASLSVEIVESLPTTDISTTTIYLINVSGTNNYNQWMYINNAWANIGSTSVDLTNYYTKGQTDTLLDSKVDKVSGKGLSTNDFTNAYKSILDNYTVDSTLNSTSTNPIQNGTVTDALNTKQPKTLSSPITIGGTSQTTVESALGGLNSLCGTKLTMVTSLPLSPSNQETVLYIGNSSGGLLCGGIYQYQVSEWVMISNVSSFTFNSDEFAVDSTTNEVSLKPSYADIPSFLPNNVSSTNKLATNSSITAITDLIPTDASANNKLVTQNELEKKQDFRIFNSLEEFNEKKGTSLTVVSGIDNMKDIANAMSNGEMLIIIVKYELGSEVYFGLTASTGWTKMFTFIKSNGLCDVECRTTFPLTLKRVLNSDGVIGEWQQLATSDDMTILLKNKMSCYTWGTDNTLKVVFYEITDQGILPDVNDAVGKRIIARYGNVLINRITQMNGVKNLYWDDTLVLSCPWDDNTTKLTDVLEIFAGTTSWEQVATMANVAHEVGTSYMSNGVLNILSIRQSLGAGCYEIMGQGNSGHGSIRLNIWQVSSGAFAFSCCITDFSGVRSICNNEGDSPTVDVGTSYFTTTNKIIKIF